MPEPQPKPLPLTALRLKHKDGYDAVAMAFYLVLVYVWGLWIYPLGRDYETFAVSSSPSLWRPWPLDEFLHWEASSFGANPVPYHLVNLLAMYACMLLIYHFVNLAVRGLWWFGTLAACLFMANPVHSESIHNLSGIVDLVPCVVALAALTAYAALAAKPSRIRWILAIVPLGIAVAHVDGLWPLGFVVLLYENLVVPRSQRSPWRTTIGVIAALVGLWFGVQDIVPSLLNPGQQFGSLYLLFYPIGFLPETVENFHLRPWLAWIAAIVVGVILFLIQRKVLRRAFLFAVLSMLVIRLATDQRPMDLVHMIGGGQLLLANALFVLALITVIFRIMDNPKWRVPMISITTMLVVIMFAMQWRSLRNWKSAGEFVSVFQAQARTAAADAGVSSIGVLPDYRHVGGAPVCLSDSLAHRSPFGFPIAVHSLLPVNARALDELEVSMKRSGPDSASVEIQSDESASIWQLMPDAAAMNEMSLVLPKSAIRPAEVTLNVKQTEPTTLHIDVVGRAPLPVLIVPAELPREKTDGESQANADNQ